MREEVRKRRDSLSSFHCDQFDVGWDCCIEREQTLRMVERLSRRIGLGHRRKEIRFRISLLHVSGDSTTSAQRLRPVFVRKALSASLSEVFWTVFMKARVDLLARL